ncbi:MAG: hypothetical protein J6039_00040 [Alphaproteobacteria bacterium]|nr:hypothetical protein [Alphaproteobacteria bacterium]
MKKYELLMHYIQNDVFLSKDDVFESLKELYDDRQRTQSRFCLGMILYGLSVRKPTFDELLGLVDFLKYVEPSVLSCKTKLSVDGSVIGMAGSGKKGVKTFNISTLAALVASSVGCFVSKNVSKSLSSITGSTDILSNAGINMDISFDAMVSVLKEIRLGFFQIEKRIPTFDAFYDGIFLVPHALSYVLAALVNPIRCDSIVYGFSGKNIEISGRLLKQLGYSKGAVVCSSNDNRLYIDELTPLKYNNIFDISTTQLNENLDINKLFGCDYCTPEELKSGKDISVQLEIFDRCLKGKASESQNNAVAMNAAILIKEANISTDLRDAFNIAYDSILSGKALKQFKEFKEACSDMGATYAK